MAFGAARRVGIDISSAIDPRPSGVARYILGLAQGLLALPGHPEIRFVARLSRLRRGELPSELKEHGARWLFPWESCGDVDLFHGADLRLPGGRRKPALVATIHDLSHLEEEGHASAAFLKKKRAHLFRAIEDADEIITHSKSVREGLIAKLAVDPERISAIPLADSLPRAVGGESRKRREHLLAVGGPSPRKGCERLPAFLDFWESRLAWLPPIVWVGSAPPAGAEEVFARLSPAQRSRVRFLGHVTDAALAGLYHGCSGLLSLSPNEGFGLPLLEAANRDCPVLALASPPLQELLGDAAFWFSDEPEASLEVFQRFRDASERRRVAEAARARATGYSWERTASETLDLYERAFLASQRRG